MFCEVDYKEAGIFGGKLGSCGLNLLKRKIGGARNEVREFSGGSGLGICDYMLLRRFLREAATLSMGMLLRRQCLAVVTWMVLIWGALCYPAHGKNPHFSVWVRAEDHFSALRWFFRQVGSNWSAKVGGGCVWCVWVFASCWLRRTKALNSELLSQCNLCAPKGFPNPAARQLTSLHQQPGSRLPALRVHACKELPALPAARPPASPPSFLAQILPQRKKLLHGWGVSQA